MCCVELPARPRDTWPAQIVDVKRAIAWVKEHIGKHGGDPDFVVVTGGSAGGHLAALAALTPGIAGFQPGFEDTDTRVQAANVRVNPTWRSCCPAWYSSRNCPSPMSWVAPEAPPLFIAHGTNDTLVPVEHAARIRCLHLGAHPSHPAGDRPPSCGGALPRRECGHAQRVVPGGLVRRGAAGPPARGIRPEARPTVRRPVRQPTFRPDPYARLFGERKQHEAQHVVCPMPSVDQFEMGNQRRRRSPPHRVFRRARSPPGSQRRTHGDNPDHRLPRATSTERPAMGSSSFSELPGIGPPLATDVIGV